MAIKDVNLPQNNNSGLSTLSGLSKGIGGFVSMIPPLAPIGAGMVAAGTIGGTIAEANQQNQPSPNQPLDTYGAMRRRQQQDNPEQSITDAIAALDTMNLPDEKYRAYKAPLYQALQKQGGIA